MSHYPAACRLPLIARVIGAHMFCTVRYSIKYTASFIGHMPICISETVYRLVGARNHQTEMHIWRHLTKMTEGSKAAAMHVPLGVGG